MKKDNPDKAEGFKSNFIAFVYHCMSPYSLVLSDIDTSFYQTDIKAICTVNLTVSIDFLFLSDVEKIKAAFLATDVGFAPVFNLRSVPSCGWPEAWSVRLLVGEDFHNRFDEWLLARTEAERARRKANEAVTKLKEDVRSLKRKIRK